MTALLVIIYAAFIGLGLPDALLGSAWPAIQGELMAPLGLAGIISMIVTAGTIVASLYSSRFICRFGTGKVTLVSVAMTAAALLGFSLSGSVTMLCIMAIPLGLGAGSVDAALNNFVALHYKAMHMSWLHCFWGVGATVGPAIMSFFLMSHGGWKNGYLTIGIIQFCLVVALLLSLPKWKLAEPNGTVDSSREQTSISNWEALHIPHIKLALVSFVLYCGVELMVGLWSSSFFVEVKGMSISDAARCASYFYGSITVGRFLSGFLTIKMANRQIIRMGQLLCVVGSILLLIPEESAYLAVSGIVLIGLGAAPIYPCMLHETPNRFGKDVSQAVMGLQMAFAYIGSTIFPSLLGGLASLTGIVVLPSALLLCTVAMLLASELLQKRITQQNSRNFT
ncbi:MAG: MFS transporter [Angelakisella sp.]